MPISIKNPDVDRLIDEITAVTGESKTEAVRRALLERRTRLRERITPEARRTHILRFLEREVWSVVPDEQFGRAPDRAEREAILGYGPEGV
jgi:antitoxin VapB